MRYNAERDRQDRHEYPAGTGFVSGEDQRGSLNDKQSLYHHHAVPDNEYEALMVTLPLEEPQATKDELLIGALAMENIMDLLTPQERSVIELVIISGMSLAEAGVWLAKEMGREAAYTKQGVQKIRDGALRKLREVLDVD